MNRLDSGRARAIGIPSCWEDPYPELTLLTVHQHHIQLVTGLKKNMHTDKPNLLEDAVLLRKRSVIEIIIDVHVHEREEIFDGIL